MKNEAKRNRPRRSALRGGTRSSWAAALIVALVAGTAAGSETIWPQSREGAVAKGWVEAFGAGEPVMRKFLAENVSAPSLAAKSVDERIVGYRSLRERLGALTLARVLEERPGALDVGLTDAHGTEHEFTFELESSEADGAERPSKLRSITARLTQGHSMFPH